MPYIEQDLRAEYLKILDPLIEAPITHPGELNYLVTMMCLSYIDDNGESYETLNAIVGALECDKLEFYRRAVSVYEDEKKKMNGDVY